MHIERQFRELEKIEEISAYNINKIDLFASKTCALIYRTTIRDIYDVASKYEPYNALKIAILSYWGKEKSWMTWM